MGLPEIPTSTTPGIALFAYALAIKSSSSAFASGILEALAT
jgi:hypothetical protein